METDRPSALLGEMVEQRTEKVALGKDLSRPYVGLEHMASNSPDLLGSARSDTSVSTNSIFERDDILFGKLRPNLKKCVLAPFPGYCSTDIIVLRARDAFVPAFVAKVFQSDLVFNQAVKTAVGTKMPRTSWASLAALRVFCPADKEQQRIATILDSLNDAIRRTEQVIAKLQQMKHGLLHDLLTRGLDEHGHLRPTPNEAPNLYKDSPLGRIPRTWEGEVLSRVGVELIDGDRGTEYPKESDFSPSGYCLFLSAKNVTRNGFRFDEMAFISEKKDGKLGNGRLRRQDIVVTTRGTLGNFAYYDFTVPFQHIRINSGMVIVRNHDCVMVNLFLYEYLRSSLTSLQIAAASYGSAQPQLNLDILGKLRVAVPPVEEQQAIVRRTEQMQLLREKEAAELLKLRTLKHGLLHDLLTGRVRVPLPAETTV